MPDEMVDLMHALAEFVERERGDFCNPMQDERVREALAKAFSDAVRAEVREMLRNA